MQNGQKKAWPDDTRRGGLGLAALLLAVAAFFTLAATAAAALLRFRAAELTAERIALFRALLLVSAGLALAGFGAAVAAFFCKRQKNGLAGLAAALAVLVFAVSFGATYAYRYMFGELTNDDAFRDIDASQLRVYEPEADGRIVRETELPEQTLSPEEILGSIDIEQVQWEDLTDEDIPPDALKKMNSGAPVNHSYLLEGSDQISNFLLIGLDDYGSSDSMIIFSLDRVHRKIKMISLARDTYVMYPAWGKYGKLNYAYNFGGIEWTIATINYNFSLNITDYITVEMAELEKIIDLVGGVDIELTAAEAPYIRVPAGRNHLNGEQAVGYARIREIDSEEARTGRQRKVLTSILNSVVTLPLTEYPALIRGCLGLCQTSFSADELMALASEAALGGYSIEQNALIALVDYWGGQFGPGEHFYVVYDLNRASDTLYRLIYEELYISGYMDPDEQ